MRWGIVLAGLWAAGAAMAAEPYPRAPIRMVVPFSAGGGTDVLARVVAAGLSEKLGQQVIVENRVGAGSLVGTDGVAKAAPDGYTVLYTSVAYAINRSLYKKLPYGPDDLVPIAVAGTAPLVLALNPSVPADDLPSLLKLFRDHPGQFNFGSSGVGTTMHMAAELFRTMGAVNLVHVPYRGASPAMTDLLAGQLAFTFDQISTAAPLVEAGKLKAIAVSTSRRSPLLPNVPTLAEAGLPGYEAYTWNLILVPRGTPKDRIAILHKAISELLASQGLKQRYADLGADAEPPLSPEGTAAFVAREIEKWSVAVKASGLSVD